MSCEERASDFTKRIAHQPENLKRSIGKKVSGTFLFLAGEEFRRQEDAQEALRMDPRKVKSVE